jgi:hypothetical protein
MRRPDIAKDIPTELPMRIMQEILKLGRLRFQIPLFDIERLSIRPTPVTIRPTFGEGRRAGSCFVAGDRDGT